MNKNIRDLFKRSHCCGAKPSIGSFIIMRTEFVSFRCKVCDFKFAEKLYINRKISMLYIFYENFTCKIDFKKNSNKDITFNNKKIANINFDVSLSRYLKQYKKNCIFE